MKLLFGGTLWGRLTMVFGTRDRFFLPGFWTPGFV